MLSLKVSSRILSIGGGFLLGALGLLATMVTVNAFVQGKEKAVAEAAGFSTYEEYKLRKAQGYSTKAQYETHLKLQQEQQRLARKQEADKSEIQRRAENLAEEQKCKKDLQCWADRKSISAAVRCQKPVESMAKYDFEWTDGWLEPKFSHFRWDNKGKLWVTYIGDKIKFQNGFGAWQRYRYECDFDTMNDVVLDVRAQPGRIR